MLVITRLKVHPRMRAPTKADGSLPVKRLPCVPRSMHTYSADVGEGGSQDALRNDRERLSRRRVRQLDLRVAVVERAYLDRNRACRQPDRRIGLLKDACAAGHVDDRQ